MIILSLLQNVTKGQVARYMFMPQVVPRLQQFFNTGFSDLAYLIALAYRAVNILPDNHFVLQRQNRAGLGVRQVMAAAASEIKFTRSNIDQIIIYFAILLGMVLLAGQFLLTLGYLMVNPAMAQTVGMPTNMPTTYGEFFMDPTEVDVAYRLLFTVFGVPELFKADGAVSQYHSALHSLFQFYSIGLLVVAVIIICYYVFAVVVETAQTGVPFGKRYNHVWTPIRLVFALGLLIPVGYGLNAGQWITLYSAKFGSDFATKGWNVFNEAMNESMLNNPEQRVATPQPPNMMRLASFMMTALACQRGYEKLYTGNNKKLILAYLVKNPNEGQGQPLSSKNFKQAHEYFNKGDIVIRFGELNADIHTKQLGYVYPYCGDIIISSSDAHEPGSLHIQEYYYNLINRIYFKADGFILGPADPASTGEFGIKKAAYDFMDKLSATKAEMEGALPPSEFKSELNKKLTEEVREKIDEAVKKQGKSETWKEGMDEILRFGWAGAGIWYNKIAQVNGSLSTAVSNVPHASVLPALMRYMQDKQLQENNETPQPFSPVLKDGQLIQFQQEADREIAYRLSYLQDYWNKEDGQLDGEGSHVTPTSNIFIDVINLIFGTQGLFDMCKSADSHPMAQLSVLGKGLVESSIRNVATGLVLSAGTLVPFIGPALGAASSILLSIATVTISMGFLLFYVIPFLPFLYFFFAVGGWLKGIFEAMVGVPLWALAFLRIDGEGLTGDAAMKGVYLIFEIFLRPILIIFGLLAAFVIFGAMVKILNEIFSLVVVNLAGHDPTATAVCGKETGGGGAAAGETPMSYFRGPVDELFFTVIYAIIVYMIGMSCFKLIDLIPNNILRFMGTDAKSFNDQASDPTQGMMQSLSVGGMATSGKVINDIAGGAAGAVGNTFKAGYEIATK